MSEKRDKKHIVPDPDIPEDSFASSESAKIACKRDYSYKEIAERSYKKVWISPL